MLCKEKAKILVNCNILVPASLDVSIWKCLDINEQSNNYVSFDTCSEPWHRIYRPRFCLHHRTESESHEVGLHSALQIIDSSKLISDSWDFQTVSINWFGILSTPLLKGQSETQATWAWLELSLYSQGCFWISDLRVSKGIDSKR